ncbi:uncharacterized protein LOC127849064 [Dreissena polymorpha]|uniref:uncharacterized protein LOC127849064 n=1 Tax=Dreissena polymorpha TaxID=45954 RepID=UPI002263C75C|nr:uncharacterized protein LOC127849064 [Dreissena polymorpha]
MKNKLSIRRWLGVPRSFSSIGLYRSGSKLQLPLPSPTEEVKVTKVRQCGRKSHRSAGVSQHRSEVGGSQGSRRRRIQAHTQRHQQHLRARNTDGGTRSSARLQQACGVARKKKPSMQTRPTFINFVKEGGSASSNNRSTNSGIIASTSDWELMVDLKKLKFPPDVASKTLHPDVLLLSIARMKLVLLDPTVPWEQRMEEALERNKAKSQPLLDECRRQGWKTWNLPIEVGSRGLAGQSLWKVYGVHVLGITGMAKRRAIADVCRQAESASKWLCKMREQQWTANQSLVEI